MYIRSSVSKCFPVPIPCFESITGSFKQISLHGNAIVCIHIVLQLGVIIGEILKNIIRKENESKNQKHSRIYKYATFSGVDEGQVSGCSHVQK